MQELRRKGLPGQLKQSQNETHQSHLVPVPVSKQAEAYGGTWLGQVTDNKQNTIVIVCAAQTTRSPIRHIAQLPIEIVN